MQKYKNKINNCKDCQGYGYYQDVESSGLIAKNDPYHKPHIERCDTCQFFTSDLEAVGFHATKLTQKQIKFIK